MIALKNFRTCLLLGGLAAALLPLRGDAQPSFDASKPGPAPVAAPRDGQHDFDFHIGTWKTRVSILRKPLTGSTTWVDYEGTTIVRKVWDGRGQSGGTRGRRPGRPHRRPESPSLQPRVAPVEPQLQPTAGEATLCPPTIGEFRNGRGEFYATGGSRRPCHFRSIRHLGYHSGFVPVRTGILCGWGQDLGSELDRDGHAGEKRSRKSAVSCRWG